MTKVIAMPINHYKDDEKPALHFKSVLACAEHMDFSITRIYEAIREGKPVKGYFLDEEIEQ